MKKAPAFVALGLYAVSVLFQWTNFFAIRPRHPFMLSLIIGMTAMAVGFILRLIYINSLLSVGTFIAMDLVCSCKK
ncbi:hypothetical protein B0H19DRAFT_1107129 [Mycena capillaripes]|nr:hypothetical protein B0H19DRAFT_1107129 [Mycena capillaripes]